MAARYAAPLGRRTPAQRRERARAADVQLVDVIAPGRTLLVALSRSQSGTAYLLEADGRGRWCCTCRGFGIRGTCQHIDAASARIAERIAAGATPRAAAAPTTHEGRYVA